MRIRETINSNPAVGYSIAAALLITAGVIIYLVTRPPKVINLDWEWYTDDNGKSWFAAKSTIHIPPFTHNGREAVIANVYSYDNGTKYYCAYMTKFDEEGMKLRAKILEDFKNHVGAFAPGMSNLLDLSPEANMHLFVKRPEDKYWIHLGDPGTARIVTPLPTPDHTPPDLDVPGLHF